MSGQEFKKETKQKIFIRSLNKIIKKADIRQPAADIRHPTADTRHQTDPLILPPDLFLLLWDKSATYLENVLVLSAKQIMSWMCLGYVCLGHVWNFGTCLSHFWDMNGTCLGHIWDMYLANMGHV